MTKLLRPAHDYEAQWQNRPYEIDNAVDRLDDIPANGFCYGYLILPRPLAEQLATDRAWLLDPDTPEWYAGWQAGFQARLGGL